MRSLRFVALTLAACGCSVLMLIVLNVAQHGPLPLHRFRETTWVVHAALVCWALAHGWQAQGDLRHRIATFVAGRRFFAFMMGTMLLLYMLTAVTQHLAFRTFSHDFSMIDAALFHTHTHTHTVSLAGILYSPLLGRSFLSEHFSPALLLLVPVHAVFTTPWLLVFVQPMVLWTAAWVLKRVLDEQGTSPALRNMALLVYLNHPVTISTLSYLFHMECFLPFCLFGAFLALQRRQPLMFAAAILLGLAIKEDVGVYLVGFAAWLCLGARQWRYGVPLALVGGAWTFLAVSEWMPRFGASPHTYAFLERWRSWGPEPIGIVLGYLRDPVRFFTALVRDPIPRYLACLGFLPFLRPHTLLLFAVPWIVNATSDSVQQASMSLYYGMPFLVFALLASVVAMRSQRFVRVHARRWSFAAAWVVVMLNLAHLTFPEIPVDRFVALRHIRAIPEQASVQAMSCFFPVLDYARSPGLLVADSELQADYVLLRRRGGTWPLPAAHVERLLDTARRGGYEDVYASRDFAVLRRETRRRAP